MCGIAGHFHSASGPAPSLELLRRQIGVLRHRGPDSEGVITLGPAALGQTRLAVVDLVTGDPPITNEDGTIAVAFNGEIYNFRSLKAELSGRGHRFASSGDTEVIAHLAEELPVEQLVHKLDGMFAFAVWDDRRGRLVLGRDRFGKKPLYWWYGGGRLVFGSELKALFAHPAVPRRLNERAIVPYLTFGYVPTPETFYEGVQSLPPGHLLTMADGAEPVVSEYWRPPMPVRSCSSPSVPSIRDAVRETRSRVSDAVERRLVSDVPLGAFLSGGLDSSVVVATMAKMADHPVRTFTIGFNDSEGFDERDYARLVAKRYHTDHAEFLVEPRAVDLVEELLWHYDQPFGDSSAIPTYLLSKYTREHVTVAMSGDGGDELFAGYERFLASLVFARYLALPSRLRAGVTCALARLPQTSRRSRVDSLRRLLASGDSELIQTFTNWLAYLPPSVRVAMLGSDHADKEALREYREVWAGSDGHDLLTRLLDLNARTYLVDDLLVKMDRMSMAHGLEVRSPFLDHQLADYVFQLPGSFKVRRFKLKYLLRQAFASDVPAPILSRRKQGFGVPLDRWFRTDIRSYVDSMLGPGARLRGKLNASAIDDVLVAHRSGKRNYGHGLWALLTLELFLRREGW
jgi:asparagine synthase (glutamine-hydrolysing)